MEFIHEKGWLRKALDSVEKETKDWPRWMIDGVESIQVRRIIMKPVISIWEVKSTGDNHIHVYCPGCEAIHGVTIKLDRSGWTWNGDKEKPTFSPSILVNGRKESNGVRCHSFIREGQWQFLSDCEHKLAGQTVDMVPLPDWAKNDDEEPK